MKMSPWATDFDDLFREKIFAYIKDHMTTISTVAWEIGIANQVTLRKFLLENGPISPVTRRRIIDWYLSREKELM